MCGNSTCFSRPHALTGAVAISWWMCRVAAYVGGQQPGMAVKAPSNVLSAEVEVAGKEVPLREC